MRKLERWQIWSGAAVGVAAVATISYGIASRFSSGRLPAGVVPPQPSAVPFAKIRGARSWPISSKHSRVGEVAYVDVNGVTHGNGSRRFGAVRPNGRRHAGVDLYGYNGDPVLAMADGTVVATQTFELGTSAILVEHNGAVVLYGEVDPASWQEFGVKIGSRVRRGDPIARIGCMVGTWQNCDSHMLHLETYVPGTTKNESWSGDPPAELLDPTHLLLTATTPEALA